MKFILSCILSLFVSLTFAQGPILQLLFEGNLADSSGNNVQSSIAGAYTYSATHYQGDSSFYPQTANWETNDSIELGRHFTVSGWFRMSTATGSGANVATNYTSSAVGFYIRLEGLNNRIKIYTKDNTYGIIYAYSNINVFTDLEWFHLVVVFDSSIVRFYVNGNDVGYDSNNDSLINPYFPTKLPIAINGYRDGSQTYSSQYRYDNVQLYDYVCTKDQIDSLYNNGATSFKLSSGEQGEEEPPLLVGYTEKKPLKSSVTKKFLRNTVLSVPYRMDYVEEQDPQDGLIVYFSDNFEGWAIQNPIPYDTVRDKWQAEMINYYSSNQINQSIVSVAGYNNVWRSQYLEGQGGINNGFAVFALLDEPQLEEIYVGTDVYFFSNWYDDTSDGMYSGKWPGGGVGSGYNGSTSIDSSGNYHSKGFAVHNSWHSYNGSTPPNRLGTYIYEQNLTMSATPIGTIVANQGYWRSVIRRVKLNTPGLSDGFVETYIDGVMVQQITGLKFRSLAQYNAGFNYIEGLDIKYAFGGDATYISQQDNVVYFDNVVAYAYEPTSPYYRSGLSEAGRVIPVVQGTLTNHYPDKICINRNYTASSGTINGVTTSYRKVPYSQNNTTDFRTFTITGHSNPIRLAFTKWYDGLARTSDDMWVKIYSGTGSTKTLLYTYNEAARDGVPTIGSTLTIPSTSCTIEYCTGKDSSYSPEINYW